MKHEIKFTDWEIEDLDYDVVVDGNEYVADCDCNKFYRNGEQISENEFRTVLLECGYGVEFCERYDEFWTRWDYWARYIKVKTIEGVQGVYKDPEGNEWYSAWNETHSNKATE